MPARTQSSYAQVLRDPRLSLLLAGDAASKVGDGMLVVALPVQTLHSHGSLHPAVAISLVEAAPFALSIPLSFVVGLGRRRFDPGRLLGVDCLLRAAVFGCLGVAATAGRLGITSLLLALLVGSTVRVLGVTGRRLLVTGLAGPDGRFAANGLLGFSDNVAASAAGPALGGLLTAAFGPGLVLLVDGLTYLPLLLAVVVARRAQPAAVVESTATPMVSGLAIMRRIPFARRMFAVLFWFFVFYGPVEVALPLLTRGPLHAGGAALGEIWTAFGIGTIVGALLTSELRRLPQIPLVVAMIALWGGALAVVAVAPSVLVAAVSFAAGGLFWAPFTAVVYSLLQARLTADEQQPVLTLWSAGAAVTAPIGLLLAGPLVQVVGPRGSLLLSAALTIALVPGALAALRDHA